MSSGHRRQVGSRWGQSLHAGLFIHRHAPRSRGARQGGRLGQLADLPRDNQHLLHLPLKVRIAALQIVFDLVRAYGRVAQDHMDGRLGRRRHRGVPGRPGGAADVLGQSRAGPPFGRQPVVFGFGAGHRQHPGLGFGGEGWVRTMRVVAQGDRHAGGQRSVHMLVDDAPAQPQGAAEGAETLSGVVTEQKLGPLHLAQRRRARSGQRLEMLLLLRREDQGGTGSGVGHHP